MWINFVKHSNSIEGYVWLIAGHPISVQCSKHTRKPPPLPAAKAAAANTHTYRDLVSYIHTRRAPSHHTVYTGKSIVEEMEEKEMEKTMNETKKNWLINILCIFFFLLCIETIFFLSFFSSFCFDQKLPRNHTHQESFHTFHSSHKIEFD